MTENARASSTSHSSTTPSASVREACCSRLTSLVRLLTIVAAVTTLSIDAQAKSAKRKPANLGPEPSWSYVEKKLKEKKFNPAFVKELKALYETRDFAQVLELNTLLFLRKSDDHGSQVDDVAADEVRAFMTQNGSTLSKAEKEYNVPGQVVASLLWIESRHGRNKGKYHVPSVFVHLVQADRKPVVDYLREVAPKYASGKVTKAQKKDIEKRAKKKADWAIAELKALEKTHKWKWKITQTFRGSFAGAFGMPQFIPSSYVVWARADKPKATPDLSKATHAIPSVAFYLKDHGWKRSKAETHVKALMKYNNSRDYANAILALADRVDKGVRAPSSLSAKSSKSKSKGKKELGAKTKKAKLDAKKGAKAKAVSKVSSSASSKKKISKTAAAESNSQSLARPDLVPDYKPSSSSVSPSVDAVDGPVSLPETSAAANFKVDDSAEAPPEPPYEPEP